MPDNTMRKARKRRFYEILAAICEVPEEAVGRIPVFVLRGRHEAEIMGCSGIREYGDERIVLALEKEFVTITGDALELTDFRDRALYIRGNIAALTFGATEDGSC